MRPMYVVCKKMAHKKCKGVVQLINARQANDGTWRGNCEFCRGKLRIASKSEREAYRERLDSIGGRR